MIVKMKAMDIITIGAMVALAGGIITAIGSYKEKKIIGCTDE